LRNSFQIFFAGDLPPFVEADGAIIVIASGLPMSVSADHDSVGEHVVIVIASGLPMSVSG
jgi:hypothetical protein